MSHHSKFSFNQKLLLWAFNPPPQLSGIQVCEGGGTYLWSKYLVNVSASSLYVTTIHRSAVTSQANQINIPNLTNASDKLRFAVHLKKIKPKRICRHLSKPIVSSQSYEPSTVVIYGYRGKIPILKFADM